MNGEVLWKKNECSEMTVSWSYDVVYGYKGFTVKSWFLTTESLPDKMLFL